MKIHLTLSNIRNLNIRIIDDNVENEIFEQYSFYV